MSKITDSAQLVEVEPILLKDLAETLSQTHIFAATPITAITVWWSAPSA